MIQMAGDDGGDALLLFDERTGKSAHHVGPEVQLSAEARSWTWVGPTGTLAWCVRDASCPADLIVLNGGLDMSYSADLQQAITEMITRAAVGRRPTTINQVWPQSPPAADAALG